MRMPTSRRVLVFLNSLEMGGTQINAVDLADGVRSFGFEPHLAGWRGPTMGLVEVAGRRGLSIEVLQRSATSVGRARTVAALYQGLKPDLVHVYGGVEARAGFWGAALLGRVPLILTVYEMRIPRNFYRSPALVVGTGYLAEAYAKRRGPTVLISPPVDTTRDQVISAGGEQLDAGRPAQGRIRLVMVTRVDEAMKARHIEAAMATMRHLPEHVDLTVVGTGDAMHRLSRLATDTNGELGRTAVQMVGEMTDPRPAYAAADIIMGMGSSAARGLSFGKPLVVIGEYGVPELFTPMSSLSIFHRSFWNERRPSRETEAIEDLLQPLVQDQRLREELGVYGRGFAERNFSLREMTDRLAALYGSMATSGSWRSDWLRDGLLDLCNTPRIAWTHARPLVLRK